MLTTAGGREGGSAGGGRAGEGTEVGARMVPPEAERTELFSENNCDPRPTPKNRENTKKNAAETPMKTVDLPTSVYKTIGVSTIWFGGAEVCKWEEWFRCPTVWSLGQGFS